MSFGSESRALLAGLKSTSQGHGEDNIFVSIGKAQLFTGFEVSYL